MLSISKYVVPVDSAFRGRSLNERVLKQRFSKWNQIVTKMSKFLEYKNQPP